MPFTHHNGAYLTVGDARIYYEESGDPAGQPLLFLHGGLGCLSDCNALLKRLPSRLRLIGMDLRGHGRSTLGSAELSYLRHQTDVEALCEHLDLRDVIILGFSDGGIAAFKLAAARRPRISHVIAAGAHWRLLADAPARDRFARIDSSTWRQRFPDAVAHYEQVNPEPDFNRLVRAVKHLWLDASGQDYPNASISQIAIPMLLIRGDSDFLLERDEMAQFQARVKHARLLNLPSAGHDVLNEAAEASASAIRAFLEAS
ncbi:alpha/beta fold hydrolase [Chromobacterium amazonense]|uniref:Alpha/beta fold hydrolase n=1 Tax=Chromobacterium amazonense TaxID=1382803 RepID=A0ABU8UX85_9NEIS|nr:alpha/beta fold hydrolase [Chromobacterium amazonense]MDQ4539151.1 alpha/beta fold hydrolase [Chromobacterium amazonense]